MILGLDISTSITGATILDASGSMLFNEAWDTRNKKKFETLYDKASLVNQRLHEVRDTWDIKEVFIEQSLQSFRSGFSSARTLSTLSRFNGIVSWLSYDIFQIEPRLIAAASARKLAGLSIKRGENAKEKVLQFVLDNVKGFEVQYTKFGNPSPGVFDRADSLVVAMAGLEICKSEKK